MLQRGNEFFFSLCQCLSAFVQPAALRNRNSFGEIAHSGGLRVAVFKGRGSQGTLLKLFTTFSGLQPSNIYSRCFVVVQYEKLGVKYSTKNSGMKVRIICSFHRWNWNIISPQPGINHDSSRGSLSERLGNRPINVAKPKCHVTRFLSQYRGEFSSNKRRTFFSLSFLTR